MKFNVRFRVMFLGWKLIVAITLYLLEYKPPVCVVQVKDVHIYTTPTSRYLINIRWNSLCLSLNLQY